MVFNPYHPPDTADSEAIPVASRPMHLAAYVATTLLSFIVYHAIGLSELLNVQAVLFLACYGGVAALTAAIGFQLCFDRLVGAINLVLRMVGGLSLGLLPAYVEPLMHIGFPAYQASFAMIILILSVTALLAILIECLLRYAIDIWLRRRIRPDA